jgi:hypothetical protein
MMGQRSKAGNRYVELLMLPVGGDAARLAELPLEGF